MDLRSPDEVAFPHPMARPETRVRAIALLTRPLPGPGADWSAVPDLPTAYRGFLTDGAERIVAVLAVVARAEGAVLVHCAAGKDRTGVTVAVLLRAAGVTRRAVVDDYLATAAHMPAVRARGRAVAGPADPTHRQRLMGTPREAVVSVLDVLDAHPGGAPGWLRHHGARRSDVEGWRERIRAVGTHPTALGSALDPVTKGR